MNKPILIAMMGLPRSGKSTIVAQLSKHLGAPIVRRDAIRLAVHGKAYIPETEPFIKALDVYMIKSLFLSGHEIVICDETNYSKEARNHIKSEEWETVFYPVLTDPKVCKERAIATKQKYLLPVIDEMYDRYTELGDEEFRFFRQLPSGCLEFKQGVYMGPGCNKDIWPPRINSNV